MRKSIIILLLCIPIALNAKTCYVATNGNDSNPGTLDKPWATWQKGFSSLSPGDILYIRGGTYSPAASVVSGRYCGAGASGKRGSSGSVFTVMAYQGEKPVLDCRNLTGTSYDRTGILLSGCSYWVIKGLEITRADQSSGPVHVGMGIYIEGSNHVTVENCTAHHNGGPGFEIRVPDGDENQFVNCDSWSNYDPYSATPGDDADGFDIGFGRSGGGDYIIRLTGCRSWNNSDDGFDMYQYPGYSARYYLKDCWSWHNGYKPDGTTQAGDGNGFKYGLDNHSYDGVTRRYSYNCIAYNNRQRGFTQESARVKKEFYNCTSYLNQSWGFSFGYTGDGSAFEVADILKNNIAFGDGVENLHGGTFYATRTSEKNSWDATTGITVTAADFISTDGSELSRARKSDGSLPDISFLHLVAGSDLIDKGTDVGLAFSGKAPDIGTFELASSSGVITEKGPGSITLTIDPGPVHKIINITFAYASTFSAQDPVSSPQIIRILDLSGKLFMEKLLETGIGNIKFPVNLSAGMYIVTVLSGGVSMSSQKMMVY
jgi:parallel beta-helix repeat protein